ncbi:MAG: hypothetical protein ACP5MV_01055 [Candidatus Parvarchaeum sp.]
MENKTFDVFRNELSKSGIPKSKISALENELSKFGLSSDKLAEDIASYGKNLSGNYRKSFYEKAVNTISQYYYPDTAFYLSKKLFSLDKDRIINTLDLFGKEYVAFYVNFIDLGYKHSKGIEFLDELFSIGKFDESSVKSLMREDIEKRDIKELIPKEIFSNLY